MRGIERGLCGALASSELQSSCRASYACASCGGMPPLMPHEKLCFHAGIHAYLPWTPWLLPPWCRHKPTHVGSVQTTPDPDTSEKASRCKWEVYVMQMGGVCTTSKHEKAHTLQQVPWYRWELYRNIFKTITSGVDELSWTCAHAHACVASAKVSCCRSTCARKMRRNKTEMSYSNKTKGPNRSR